MTNPPIFKNIYVESPKQDYDKKCIKCVFVASNCKTTIQIFLQTYCRAVSCISTSYLQGSVQLNSVAVNRVVIAIGYYYVFLIIHSVRVIQSPLTFCTTQTHYLIFRYSSLSVCAMCFYKGKVLVNFVV